MATAIPDLWADDIKVDVATPLAILRTQEHLLGQKTKGILRGQVSTTTAEKWVQHQLDLVAPALGNYRVTLLRASHHRDAVYPVYVEFLRVSPSRDSVGEMEATVKTVIGAAVAASPITALLPRQLPAGDPANSEEEFIRLVRTGLRSNDIRALIDSLIARSNEENGVTAASNGAA